MNSDEFNERISAQRAILRTVNSARWPGEELFGVSSRAIERWRTTNALPETSPVVQLVIEAGAKLFFLANRSQECISPEYRSVASEIVALNDRIAAALRSPSAGGLGG